MGTDIYLRWDKQSQADKKKQYTGFSINSGDVGYLRASIGMTRENAILRIVFPDEYWEGKKSSFNFTENGFKELQMIGIYYLLSLITQKELKLPTKHKSSNDYFKDVMNKIAETDKNTELEIASQNI